MNYILMVKKFIIFIISLFLCVNANAEWKYNLLKDMDDHYDYYEGESTLSDYFLKLDGSNANTNIDIGTYSFSAETLYATDTGVSEFTEGALFGTTLTIDTGSITDSTGAISFGNENLTTTGTVTADTVVATNATTGQSLIKSGLAVNTLGNGTAADDFVASTNNVASALLVDASEDAVGINGTKVGFFGASPSVQSTGWAVTNEASDKVYDADATTVDELADVLGTLIEELKSKGLVGA